MSQEASSKSKYGLLMGIVAGLALVLVAVQMIQLRPATSKAQDSPKAAAADNDSQNDRSDVDSLSDSDQQHAAANESGQRSDQPSRPAAKRTGMIAGWFAERSREAHQASLLSDLQTVRSQIELYKMQHHSAYPGQQSDGSIDGDDFALDLITRTNADGTRTTSRDGYGPYLQVMATNPFIEGAHAARISVGAGPNPGDGQTGWYFDTRTGKFCANDPANKAR